MPNQSIVLPCRCIWSMTCCHGTAAFTRSAGRSTCQLSGTVASPPRYCRGSYGPAKHQQQPAHAASVPAPVCACNKSTMRARMPDSLKLHANSAVLATADMVRCCRIVLQAYSLLSTGHLTDWLCWQLLRRLCDTSAAVLTFIWTSDGCWQFQCICGVDPQLHALLPAGERLDGAACHPAHMHGTSTYSFKSHDSTAQRCAAAACNCAGSRKGVC